MMLVLMMLPIKFTQGIFSDGIKYQERSITMNAETSKVMFALLRSAICDAFLTDEEKLLYTEEMLTEMEDVTKKT